MALRVKGLARPQLLEPLALILHTLLRYCLSCALLKPTVLTVIANSIW
jgi:hypothetical protein